MKHFSKLLIYLFCLTLFWVFAPAQRSQAKPSPLLLAQKDLGEDEDFIQVDIPDTLPAASNNAETSPQTKNSTLQGKLYSWLSMGLQDKAQQAFYFNYTRLELDFTQLLGNITFRLKGNARYNSLYDNHDDGYRRGENLRLDASEAYVDYQSYAVPALTQFNFRLGIQTVNWGKADEMRPTDILSPQDLTLFALEDRNDRKLGRFAAKALFSFSEKFSAEIIWLPIQRASEATFEEDSPFTSRPLLNLFDQGFELEDFTLPQKKLSHSDLGLKLNFNLAGIDISSSFYHGYDPTPVLEIIDPLGSKDLKPRLSRVTMWGVDFERVVGSFVLRGEAAYFSKGKLFRAPLDQPELALKYGPDGFLAEKDYLDITLGLDKNDFLLPRMYLNLQYLYSHVPDYEKGLLVDNGTALNAHNHAAIWNMSYDWGNMVYRLEFSGSYSFSHGDYLLSPSFHLKIGMETKLILGAHYFGGKESTFLGQFRDKSFAFLKLEHLF